MTSVGRNEEGKVKKKVKYPHILIIVFSLNFTIHEEYLNGIKNSRGHIHSTFVLLSVDKERTGQSASYLKPL